KKLAYLAGTPDSTAIQLHWPMTSQRIRNEASMKESKQFFSEDYFVARDRFRDLTKSGGGRLHSIVLDASGPRREQLTMDIAWFGAVNPQSVLLHYSGLHGVEGFAGFAIHLQLHIVMSILPVLGA